MNIIIVAKPGALPKTINLTHTRTRVMCGLILGAASLGCGLLGVGLALAFASPRDRALAEVHALREQLGQQKQDLLRIRGDAQRDADALAVKLGELQAQATRLNALGERLTRVGKLADGEFNFNEAPAVGGPEEPAALTAPPAPLALDRTVDELNHQFARQQAQLEVLENLLLDRKIESSLMPAGMPVDAGYIASYFGGRPDPFNGASAFHSGIDVDAPAGTDIHAVAEGVVTFDGQRPGYGNVIEIDHGNGYMTRYAHNARNLAKVGDRVHVGQTVAKVGSTGRSTGTHVHFEVWLNGRALNPIAFVKSTRG
ncbi:MAG TPA: M23 family metallopeptidase [Rhodanobacteraceae bacterium]|nr:M23 family metallopeptidase [Rhodanobacteraceae bacterium]